MRFANRGDCGSSVGIAFAYSTRPPSVARALAINRLTAQIAPNPRAVITQDQPPYRPRHPRALACQTAPDWPAVVIAHAATNRRTIPQRCPARPLWRARREGPLPAEPAAAWLTTRLPRPVQNNRPSGSRAVRKPALPGPRRVTSPMMGASPRRTRGHFRQSPSQATLANVCPNETGPHHLASDCPCTSRRLLQPNRGQIVGVVAHDEMNVLVRDGVLPIIASSQGTRRRQQQTSPLRECHCTRGLNRVLCERRGSNKRATVWKHLKNCKAFWGVPESGGNETLG